MILHFYLFYFLSYAGQVAEKGSQIPGACSAVQVFPEQTNGLADRTREEKSGWNCVCALWSQRVQGCSVCFWKINRGIFKILRVYVSQKRLKSGSANRKLLGAPHLGNWGEVCMERRWKRGRKDWSPAAYRPLGWLWLGVLSVRIATFRYLQAHAGCRGSRATWPCCVLTHLRVPKQGLRTVPVNMPSNKNKQMLV